MVGVLSCFSGTLIRRHPCVLPAKVGDTLVDDGVFFLAVRTLAVCFGIACWPVEYKFSFGHGL